MKILKVISIVIFVIISVWFLYDKATSYHAFKVQEAADYRKYLAASIVNCMTFNSHNFRDGSTKTFVSTSSDLMEFCINNYLEE